MSGALPAYPALDIGNVDLSGVMSAIQNMTEGVILADSQANIILMNPAALELYGLRGEATQPPASLAGLIEYFDAGRQPLARQDWPVQRAARGDWISRLELHGRRIDTGKTWNGLYSSSAVRGRSQEVVLIIVVIENLGGNAHALFLAKLAQVLLPLKEPERIFQTVCRQTGLHLKAERCFMEEARSGATSRHIYIDYHPEQPALEGNIPTHQYPGELDGELRRGNPVAIIDVLQSQVSPDQRQFFDQSGIRSLLSVPYLRDGQWLASMTVTRSDPYEWSADEITLLQSTANLAWLSIENARLYQNLKLSEERLQLAAMNTGLILFTNDPELRYTWLYTAGDDGDSNRVVGKLDSELLPSLDAIEMTAIKRRVFDTGIGAHLEFELHIPGGTQVYDLSIEPLRSDGGEVIGLTGVALDITQQRKAEDIARHNAVQLETNRLIQTDRESGHLKIAQNLHDGPLQMAMALVMDLNEAVLMEGKSERLDKLNTIRAGMQLLAKDLRNFCAELRPPALAPFGLEKAIRSHLENFQNDHPELEIQAELMPDGQLLPDEARLAIFRIYQELLGNTVRHAHASRLSIHLTLDEAQTELEIQDNGRGFEVPLNWLDLAREGHFGLVGVLERAEALDGRVCIRSAPGQGTLVRVVIPRGLSTGRLG